MPASAAFEFVDYVAILKELHQRRARHEEVRRVLDLVGLGAVRRRRVGRCPAACAGESRWRNTAGRPDLLILDEPTAGLDPEQRLRFRELVGRLGEGTHRAVHAPDRGRVRAVLAVMVLHLGKLRFAGTPLELAGLAQGHVWHSQSATLARWAPGARHRSAPQHRQSPAGADLLEPTLEDGYLLLLGGDRVEEVSMTERSEVIIWRGGADPLAARRQGRASRSAERP